MVRLKNLILENIEYEKMFDELINKLSQSKVFTNVFLMLNEKKPICIMTQGGSLKDEKTIKKIVKKSGLDDYVNILYSIGGDYRIIKRAYLDGTGNAKIIEY